MHSKEVLAVILQGTVEEYKEYSRKEIMGFIEAGSIDESKEVSTGRTNTQLHGERAEFVQLNEKTSNFDIAFRARNPKISNENVLVSLHIDIEPQKTYRPGYPIEKRGMYYLARRLSSQLALVTEQTDYKQLEKCYSIWICRDDIPVKARNSISCYGMSNLWNTGENITSREDYDLITLVVIKLGNPQYTGTKDDEGYELLRFLNALMYPHKDDFLDVAAEYIDFSDNEELWKEITHMGGLGQSILEEGIEQGIEQGLEQGIRAFILDHLEEQIPKERSVRKLQKCFELTQAEAEEYYKKIAGE